MPKKIVSVLFCLWLLVSILGCAAAPQSALRGGRFEPALPAPDFTLTDQHGAPFTFSSTRGKVALIYFGYTSCPDVCPLTLADVSAAVSGLGDAAQDVKVIFITVDPARDTRPVLEKYVAAFNPTFIGLRGTDAEIKTVADGYGAKYKKTTLNNSALGYAVDHSALIYVIDRSGRLRETFPFGADRDDIRNDLKQLTEESISS